MARSSPPFPRGAFGTGYSDPSTVDAKSGQQLEGMEWVFEDLDPTATFQAGATRTGRQVRCRCVRNTSGGTLNPKRFVKFDVTNGELTSDGLYSYGNQVSGYASVGNAGGVVDEYLPAGPGANDLFWLVIQGPSALRADNASTFAVGDHVVPDATPAGKGASVTPSATPATLYDQIMGVQARAMQALGVAADVDILVDVIRHR